MHGLSFLFGNVLLDHLVRDGSRGRSKVSSGPYVSPPQLLPQMWEFLKEYPWTRSFQPLSHFANGMVGMIGNQDVNMVARHFAAQNLQIMLHSDLAYQVAHTNRYRPYQYLLTIFGHPHQVDFKIVFCVRAYSVTFHATILHEFSLRLKARGFHHPRRRH